MDESEKQISDFFDAMDRLGRAWHSVTPCENISKSQFATLMAVHRHEMQTEKENERPDPITLSALAAFMQQSVPALSQRVRTLEDTGYIERVPDEKDRRISGVRLTDSGNEMLRVAKQKFTATMQQAIAMIGTEAAEQLTDSISRLAEAFETVVAENTEEKNR